jgi:hypothetical protein
MFHACPRPLEKLGSGANTCPGVIGGVGTRAKDTDRHLGAAARLLECLQHFLPMARDQRAQ